MSAPAHNRPDRFGRAFILLGLGLVGSFLLISRWLLTSGHGGGILARVFISEPTVLGLLIVTTILLITGTAALLQRRPTGSVSLTDIAFIAVGAIAGGAGVWFSTRLALETILAR